MCESGEAEQSDRVDMDGVNTKARQNAGPIFELILNSRSRLSLRDDVAALLGINSSAARWLLDRSLLDFMREHTEESLEEVDPVD